MKNEFFAPLYLKRKLLAVMVAACYGASHVGLVHANPLGPQVLAGQAVFGQQGDLYSITNTPNTIINWQAFSINPNEITRFIQQSSDSKVLNRITGQDPSQILGALQSNGKVFLINPNGVLFGKDARIDVQGLVASSLALSNQDFLAGKNNFGTGAADAAGTVINRGAIVTPNGGQVYLIASSVENSGIINSPQGDIVLAAGHSVQLADAANPALRVVVSAPADQALNLGQVLAAGGQAGIYGALVNQRGVVNADSARRGVNGKIILKASGTTLLEAGSRTSAANSAGQGGTVQVLGERVALNGDASINASGKDGGGTVLVGGDFQGRNAAIPNARQVFVSADAAITADATGNGNGGKVIVWGDEAARVHGSISAQGGQGGQGGLVETSGHYLNVAGARVDTRAAQAGQAGQWLLDPESISIDAAYSGENMLSHVATFAAGDATGVTSINSSQLNTATSNITLRARKDITFASPVSVARSGVGITAQAGRNISVPSSLTTNGGAIDLQANYGDYASGSGAVTVAAAVTTNGGKFSASGASVALNGALDVGAGAVELRAASTGGAIPVGVNGGITGTAAASDRLFSFIADNISIAGSVNGGGADSDTTVSFAPYTASRGIALASDADSSKLVLSATGLGNVSALGVNIGTGSHTGGITVSQDLLLGSAVRNVFLESAGDIQVNAKVRGNTSSGVVYSGAYGTASKIAFGSGGGFEAGQVLLRADNMELGTVADTIKATSKAALTTYTSNAAIVAGADAAGASGTLVLTEAQLRSISAPALHIGDQDGGALSVAGSLDLTGGATATDALQLAGSSVALGGTVKAATALGLKSSGAITQSSGIIDTPQVYVSGASVALDNANTSNTLAGASTGNFSFRSAGQLNLATVGGLSGLAVTGAAVLNAGAGVAQDSTAPITAVSLRVTAAGSVELNGSDGNDISAVAGDGMQSFNLVNNGFLTVGVDGQGLALDSGSNGAITLLAHSGIAVQQPLSAASGSVALQGMSLVLGNEVTPANAQINGVSVSLIGNSITLQSGASVSGTAVTYQAENMALSSASSTTAGSTLTLQAGSITGAVTLPDTSRLGLQASGNIQQSTSAPVSVKELAATAASGITLQQTNSVQSLAALTTAGNILFTNNGNLTVAKLSSVGGGLGQQGITAPGNVQLNVNGNIVSGGRNIHADALRMTANGSIGASATPLSTVVSILSAESTAASGNKPINISNVNFSSNPITSHAGKLLVTKLKVSNANTGAVTLNNTGATEVDAEGVVQTVSGKISLTAHSPLTIKGSVHSDTGDIELVAGASGSSADVLSFASTAVVSSSSGTITLAAGESIAGVTGDTVQAAPGKLVQVPQQNVVPTETPTVAPTVAPTEAPTQPPTQAPTGAPTAAPTQAPTQAPTVAPTAAPTTPPAAQTPVREAVQELINTVNVVLPPVTKTEVVKKEPTLADATAAGPAGASSVHDEKSTAKEEKQESKSAEVDKVEVKKMNLSKNSIATKALLLIAFWFSCSYAMAAQVAGTVVQLSGPLLAKKASGAVKILSLKSEVESGDTLVTEKNTYAMVKFIDSSEITLKPASTLTIDNFAFDNAKPDGDSASFNLVKGGMRSVSGLLGKRNKEKFALKTPTATIGIRGTTFIADYIAGDDKGLAALQAYLNASTAGLGDSVPIAPLQLAQNIPGGTGSLPPGLYVHVIDGLISLTNRGGVQQFAAGQFGFTASLVQPPVIVPNNPGIKFAPPPAFNSSSAPKDSSKPAKSNTVDCEVR